jgi:hypothetical protein
MIAKYFKGGKSKSGAVEYLLNEREQLGTARTLRGNPELTKQLIKENSNKLKYRSGCLAFEEPNITEQQKAEIMDLFEKSTFAGLDKEQYNILWVEHTDKGRLELNFVIPRLELTSGKAFNPHWHEQDQTRLLKFQEYVNAEYGFTSAFSENKRELIRVDKNKKNSQIKKEIHQVVLDNIKSGHIQNREELLQFFQDSGATIPRKGKDYITVQFGQEKHRLKGEIYGETFTTIDSIKETIRATEREHKPTTRAELRELKQELDRLMEFKAETNRAKYPKREQDYTGEHRPRIRDTKKEQDLQVHRDSTNEPNNRDSRELLSTTKRNQRNTNEPNRTAAELQQRTSNVASAERVSTSSKTREVYSSTEREHIHGARGQNLHQDRGLEDDRVRENIKRRIERSRAEREELTARVREQVSQIHSELRRSNREIRESSSRDERELQQRARDIQSEHKQVIQESESHLQQVGNIEPTISRYARFKQRVTSYISTAREYISNTYQDLKDRYSKNFIFKQEDLETSFATQDTKKDILGREMSFKDLERVQSQFDVSATRDIQQEEQREQERQQQRSRSSGMSMRM